MKKGKRYVDAVGKYDKSQYYSVEKAVGLVKELSCTKFDETIEIALNCNIDSNKYSIRATLVLPNRFGKEQRVLVFAKGEKAEEAHNAGATYVGDTDLVNKIKEGWLDFDVALATPDMMKEVGKLGPILGRRGLMPNPKARTVTTDVNGAIEELKKGRMEFRADKTGVVHLAIGKVSMEAEKVAENAHVCIRELVKRRPTELKVDFIKSITLSSTMGPGVKVLVKDVIN